MSQSRTLSNGKDHMNDPEDHYKVPKNRKVEILFGVDVMRDLLRASSRRVLVMSVKNIRRYHIDNWLEEMVKLCDFSKVDFYCVSDKSDEPILCDKSPYTTSDFILALYDPELENFLGTISAPPDEKFRAKRYRYKTKILTFCFCAHNADFLTLMTK